jgi:pectinesterase
MSDRSGKMTSRRVLVLMPLLAIVLARASSAAPARLDVASQLDKPDAWFASPEGRKILDNVLSWQNPIGGWWKAYDASAPRPAEPVEDKTGWHNTSTFDNGATYSELRLFARAFRITQDTKYRDAFLRGMKFVFDAQYPNGGWPQRFPLEDNYGRHITFNDGAMTGVMQLLKDLADERPDFAWCEPDLRGRSRAAFERGVKCILDAQIKMNGQLTAWCQQHDEKSLAPAAARKYELPSIASGESAGILHVLMQIEQPSDDVRRSIRAGAAWFESAKITGKRFVRKRDPSLPKGRDRVIVDDPAAEPIWARFYDIDTNRPFFCGRDGVKKWTLAEVEPERRNGYAWYGGWGAEVAKEYGKWAAKYGGDASPAPSTTSASQPARTITVSPDKSAADFTSVQAAVDSIPASNKVPVTIHIKPGVYKERVRVPRDKPFVTFLGDDAATTVLTYDLVASNIIPPDTKPIGTKNSWSTFIEADDFTADRITFENSAGDVGQAVAVRTAGRRAMFRNCRMLGWQDTLYVYDGTARFTDCYIEGRVDFIFGWATAVFERCHVHSKNGGFVTAAATPKESRFGFVFLHCKLTGDGAQPAYLGRPWRDNAAVTFVRCEIGPHIRPEGWNNWSKPQREQTARFAEYNCTGPGADRSKRVPWARELTDSEASEYTADNVLTSPQTFTRPSPTARP